MAIELGAAGMEEPEAPGLPAFPALTSLDLTMREGPPLSICLPDMPALHRLALSGEGSALLAGAPDGVAPPADSPLESVRLWCSEVTAGFSLMRGVRQVALWLDRLEGAGSIAGATSLTRLELGGDRSVLCEQHWVTELLRSTPPSLLSLSVIGGCCLDNTAAVIGSLAQLRALALVADSQMALPPQSSAVWRRLRVLSLDGGSRTHLLPLPEVSLSHAASAPCCTRLLMPAGPGRDPLQQHGGASAQHAPTVPRIPLAKRFSL